MDQEFDLYLEKATQENSKIITEFQYIMAKETEGKELNTEDVFKAVDYLALNPANGFFLMAYDNKQKQNDIGSLLITYAHEVFLNKSVWWFQSVFVDAKYRGKSVFKNMFQNIQDQVQSQKLPLKLYVETENDRAMKVYKKMGMFDAEEVYLEDDFYFEDKIIFQQSQQFDYSKLDLHGDLNELEQNILKKVHGFSNECGYPKLSEQEFLKNSKNGIQHLKQKPEQGDVILIHQKGELVGSVGVFYEFSDWRNGVIMYLSDIRLNLDAIGQTAEAQTQFYSGLFYYCKKEFRTKLPLTCLRVVINENVAAVKPIVSTGMVQAHYRVYIKNT